jgi:carboxyl-terminal processing protease
LENILSMLLPAGTDTFAFEGQGFAYSGRTAGDDLMVDDDMIILINGGSASAAEMMALVLSEYDRATLVGEQTFGKGTAQSLIDYNDGSSFKYTIYERSVGDTSVQ